MASTYTVNLGIEKIGTGEQSGTWGTTTNTNFDLIDQAVNGAVTVTLASAGTSGSPNTLEITNGAASDGRNKFIDFNDGGDLGATAYVQLTPNDAEKIVHVRNSLSGGRSVIVFQGTYNASNDFEIPNGKDVVLKFDGGGASATVTQVFEDLLVTAVAATTVDTTNIEVTNLKAKDGTSAGSIADSTGVVTIASSVLTTTDINGGTIDGVTIGGASAGAITGTTITGTSFVSSGDMTFGDDDKAIFGAGSDLQIYHDGATGNSFITEGGAGNLVIVADDFRIQPIAQDRNWIAGDTNGAVELYYDGSKKLATTATGIDVTGTVTADGLQIDGAATITQSAGSDFLKFDVDGTTDEAILGIDSTDFIIDIDPTNVRASSNFVVKNDGVTNLTLNSSGDLDVNGTVTADGLTVDGNAAIAGNQPQISFEEADTTDLDVYLRLNGGDFLIETRTDAGVKVGDRIRAASNGDISFYDSAGSSQSFFWDASAEALGIGTTSPNQPLTIEYASSATTPTDDLSSDTTGALQIFNTDNSADYSGIFLRTRTSSASNALIGLRYNSSFDDGELFFKIRNDPGGSIEPLTIKASGNVGIGTSSPTQKLTVSGNIYLPDQDSKIVFAAGNSSSNTIRVEDTGGLASAEIKFLGVGAAQAQAIVFSTGNSPGVESLDEAMRIDDSQNLLVGRTSTITFGSNTTTGAVINEDGRIDAAADGQSALIIQRLNSDGNIAIFYKDGSPVGSIGASVGDLYINSGNTGLVFNDGGPNIKPCSSDGANRDNAIDLGSSSVRFDDIYATNGTIQTSDRNEKENIRELLEAEARVAQAAKGLLRAFQWKDSVAEKGDDARIHFGIIAQDLQAAFEAEGLDAGRYAMFIHSTWTDEETGEERSRMGVRYSELLAFIIAAL